MLDILSDLQARSLLRRATHIEAHMLSQTQPQDTIVRRRLSEIGEAILPVLFVAGSQNIVTRTGHVVVNVPQQDEQMVHDLLRLSFAACQPVVVCVFASGIVLLGEGFEDQRVDDVGGKKTLRLLPKASELSAIRMAQDFYDEKDNEAKATYRFIHWLRSDASL